MSTILGALFSSIIQGILTWYWKKEELKNAERNGRLKERLNNNMLERIDIQDAQDILNKPLTPANAWLLLKHPNARPYND